MQFIADRARNPFDMQPACETFVPGYGVTDADFHIIGDYPGVHGGQTTGIPFTDRPWSERFFDALVRGGLLDTADDGPETIESTLSYLSYLHMCDSATTPSTESYGEFEPYFDAELRAITAHVLCPVGQRATEHVLRAYTAIDAERAADMDDIHAEELHGSGWLVFPIADPADWTDDSESTLVTNLEALLASDYRQLSDLGRFTADSTSYFVR